MRNSTFKAFLKDVEAIVQAEPLIFGFMGMEIEE